MLTSPESPNPNQSNMDQLFQSDKFKSDDQTALKNGLFESLYAVKKYPEKNPGSGKVRPPAYFVSNPYEPEK